MAKPNWDDAPEWASWLAMDSDGDWWWYENEPEKLIYSWNMDGGRVAPAGSGHDWTETLDSRP